MPGTLLPPADGAKVRFYRIGHGDCFLIAFAGTQPAEPIYVLIDCGYKPGSPGKIVPATRPADVCADIKAATGNGHIHVAIVTHEHQDHINAITQKNFTGITIGKTWLAWTEDDDPIANQLRKEFKDKLYGLVAARHKLAAAKDAKRTKRIDSFLSLEFGGNQEQFKPPTLAALAAAGDFGANKKSLKLLRNRAKDGVKCIRPHEDIIPLPGAKDVRVFAMGPPRNIRDIKNLDPEGEEEFKLAASAGSYFAAAVRGNPASLREPPFAERFRIPTKKAQRDATFGDFFSEHYAPKSSRSSARGAADAHKKTSENAEFRRIDKEWLYSADQLAIDLNDYTNNSSLVVAFELGKGGKVLLFAADAQRGNWISWGKKSWKDGSATVNAKGLMSRTVLYKVGHHGSHNATLNGKATDTWPNLEWMATKGDSPSEFTAMITAVRKWAATQDGWNHPLPAIKNALMEKACGRVFQTDTPFQKMKQTGGEGADWARFVGRTKATDLYFDYEIPA